MTHWYRRKAQTGNRRVGRRDRMLGSAMVGAILALLAVLVPANAAAGGGGGSGAVEVCKSPGAAVAGKRFTFSIAGQEVAVTASASQTMCSQEVKVAAGTATVTEAAASGFKVAAVAATPESSLVGAPDLEQRRVTVKVVSGEETLVTFTNAAASSPPPPPPPLHTLKLCKTGGVDSSASFRFAVTRGAAAVAGSPFTLSTGECTLVGKFEVGTMLKVVESPAAGTTVKNVTSSPAALLRDVQGASAEIHVVQTASTINVLTFENRPEGTSPGHGKNVPVKLCKTGKVPAGSSFSFAVSTGGAAVAGSPFTVEAGDCVRLGSFPRGTELEITEAPAPGTELTGVAAWPSKALVSASGRTAVVRVQASFSLRKLGHARTSPVFRLVAALLKSAGAKDRHASAGSWTFASKHGKHTKHGKHGSWHRGHVSFRFKRAWSAATVVWFRNSSGTPAPAKTYPLKLCKAGDVDVKASFSFAVTKDGAAVAGSPFSLATGRCAVVGSFPLDTALQVTESPASGTAVKAVFGSPTGVVASVDGTTAAVKVVNAGWNVVVFKNRKVATQPEQTYPVKLCKAGDVDGKASFSFAVTKGGAAVSGSPFSLGVGQCTIVGSFTAGTVLAVTETPAAGTKLREVIGKPAGVVTDVSGATATVKVAAAELVKVVFVNKAEQAAPGCTCSKGFFKSTQGSAVIDKVLGSGGLALPAGTTVGGVTVTTLTTAQVHAVFDTSESALAPGSGAAFNLLQQTVTALLNAERGATVDASVKAAVKVALGGLAVDFDGKAVSGVTATSAGLAALPVLEAFNTNPATSCS